MTTVKNRVLTIRLLELLKQYPRFGIEAKIIDTSKNSLAECQQKEEKQKDEQLGMVSNNDYHC
jgi:hypothetical protein